MLPDDVYRDRLEQTLVEIEKCVAKMQNCAAIDLAVTPYYWRAAVLPVFPDACPFDLIIRADQKFSLKLDDEAFEDLPVEHFELFPHLVRAIEAGHVDRISKLDVTTDGLVAIEMRVELGPGWEWHRERRIASKPPAEEWRTHRYLAYRR